MEEREVAFFVDNDSDFLETVSCAIQHPRFDIITCHSENGYRAIDEIIRVKPDVLFIDFNLPRANGGQIISILKSVRFLSNVSIYFMTGYPKERILPFLKDVDHEKVLFKGPSLKEDILKILEERAA